MRTITQVAHKNTRPSSDRRTDVHAACSVFHCRGNRVLHPMDDVLHASGLFPASTDQAQEQILKQRVPRD